MKKTNMTLLALTAIAVSFGISNIAMSDIAQKIAVVDVPAVVASSQQVQNLKRKMNKKLKIYKNGLMLQKPTLKNNKLKKVKKSL